MKEALCRWLEEGGLEGHKNAVNMIRVVQEIGLMAKIEDISGCLYIS